MTAVPPRPSLAAELKSLWTLALPLALAQAGQALLGMVDTAVLGHLSAEAQGGVGLGNSLTFTITWAGMGVLMALDPLVSQAIGAKDQVRARTYLWQGFWLAGLVSVVVMTVVGLTPLLLRPFGIAPGVAEGASVFIWWRLAAIPGTLLFTVARSYLSGVGRTTPIFVAMVLANVVNLALDVLLVFGWGPVPAFGIPGAAVATTLSTWLQFAVLAKAMGTAPEGTRRRFHWRELMTPFRVGLPIGAHFVVESGIFSLAGLLAGRLGAAAIAAHQVALSWASFSFCVAAGIGSAATVRVGWGVGAGDTPSARRAGFLAFGSGAAFMSASALVFLFFPEPLARMMSNQADVVPVVVALFGVTAFFQIFDGVQVVGAGALRGAGDTTFPFWANLVGHWVIGLPIALTLGVYGPMGIQGVWWGLSAGLVTVSVSVFSRFWWVTRRAVATLG